jgi:NitT/TauT family transport system ATP-binding protein
MEPVLNAEGISKIYRTTQGRILALEAISFQVGAGEFLCIVGPSGCGKTTLLRILGGLLAPTCGAVCFRGEPLDSPRRQIGFVFQKANLMPWRTVLKNVTLSLEVQGMGQIKAHALAQELLELVGLGGFEKIYPHELSIGMQQRVAIARALVHDPAVLLLDEPFASLDALTRERMNLELLRIWGARRKTVVMVTHSIQEAVFLADRVLVMSPLPGRIEAAVSISLPRPRQLAVLYSQEFGLLSQQIRRAIHTADRQNGTDTR